MNPQETVFQGCPINRDPLTGLPDRALLTELLTLSLALGRRKRKDLAVLFVDLAGFDQVNDELGHRAATDFLRQATDRLISSLRESDMAAHQGSGVFIVALQNLADDGEAGRMALHLIEQLSYPFDLAGLSANAEASIGLAIFPGDGDDAAMLLRNAELAMDQTRAAGSQMPAFFNQAMQRDFLARRALEADLQQALENCALVLHYQPVLRLSSHSLAGVEALIRWNHPEHGLIGPEVFLPTAEDSGLIKPIGRWVITEACRQVDAWRLQGLDVAVAVNVSARQLPDGIPPDWLHDTMAHYGVSHRNLSFDFTEQLLQVNDPAIGQWLETMERMKIKIGLDDFGAGHSSLAQLKEFNIRQIKISRSLVGAVRSDCHARAMVKSVVDIGRNMMLPVTATGVEDANTLATLHSMGCNRVQGFHLACPDLPQRIKDFAARLVEVEDIPHQRRQPDTTTALAIV